MKICLVGHDAYGLYGNVTGGAEKQVALLARHFARRGHDVTFVMPGYGGVEEKVDKVLLRSGWLPDRGIKKLRFITYRLPYLKRVLNDVAADVYYIRGG